MIFDDNGKIAQIVPETRNDAHRLIEECMLAANVCASEFLRPTSIRGCTGPRRPDARESSPSCASSSPSSACSWAVATSPRRRLRQACSKGPGPARRCSCCRP